MPRVFCRNCGQPVEFTDKFCPYCGTALNLPPLDEEGEVIPSDEPRTAPARPVNNRRPAPQGGYTGSAAGRTGSAVGRTGSTGGYNGGGNKEPKKSYLVPVIIGIVALAILLVAVMLLFKSCSSKNDSGETAGAGETAQTSVQENSGQAEKEEAGKSEEAKAESEKADAEKAESAKAESEKAEAEKSDVEKSEETKAESEAASEPAKTIEQLAVGDTKKFGHYEQNNDTTDGAEKIKWRVLSIEGDKALLIADKCLDTLPYDAEGGDVTWETCSLRKWLNEDFYKSAFSKKEKKRILKTKLVNADNAATGTKGGNDTEDKVFLLSIDEAYTYFGENDTRIGYATKTAVAHGGEDKGLHQNVMLEGLTSGCWWWLRGSGKEQSSAIYVEVDGRIEFNGYDATVTDQSVRPAIYLDLNIEE